MVQTLVPSTVLQFGATVVVITLVHFDYLRPETTGSVKTDIKKQINSTCFTASSLDVPQQGVQLYEYSGILFHRILSAL